MISRNGQRRSLFFSYNFIQENENFHFISTLNTKMELHDTPTSKLAEIKAFSPVILYMVTTNTLPMTSVK